MKKIDMFVFRVNIICTIVGIVIILLSLALGSNILLDLLTLVDVIGGVIIFGRFMYDKNYKIQYYIGFIVCSRVFLKLIDLVVGNFIISITSLMITVVIIGVISSIFSGWIYQYFKEMSYRKNNSLEELNL